MEKVRTAWVKVVDDTLRHKLHHCTRTMFRYRFWFPLDGNYVILSDRLD
jgi:hypothetical protein